MKKYSSKGIAESFCCAFRGIGIAIAGERNLRIHMAAALLVFLLSRFYSFSAVESAVLLLAVGMVISAELFNTAIEKAVDLESPSYNALARISKDVAAGAVLVCVAFSVLVGCVLFGQQPGLSLAVGWLLQHPLVVVASAVILLAWVFVLPRKANRHTTHTTQGSAKKGTKI